MMWSAACVADNYVMLQVNNVSCDRCCSLVIWCIASVTASNSVMLQVVIIISKVSIVSIVSNIVSIVILWVIIWVIL